MEHPKGSAEMLEQLIFPAFLVRNGVIVKANHAALQMQVTINSPVDLIIEIGAEEYSQYTDGKLCLTLLINGISHAACVTNIDGDHLFCLESDYQAAEFRAFALAAQYLRGPLSTAISGTEQLLQNETTQECGSNNLVAQINRSLHQIFRAVGNMSDVAQYQATQTTNMLVQDAIWFFDELLQKTAALCEYAGKKLVYSVPQIGTSCMLDREQLERAVYNLISNALKYSAPGSIVRADLTYRANRLYFTVENDLVDADPQLCTGIFSRYLREPGIEDGRTGIGLGMSIVQNAAAKHGGTVLLECPDDNRMRVTMTIQVKQPSKDILSSPVRLPIDYSGGFDHALIELSDALPFSAYTEKF